MSNVIESYLVSLGFQTDSASLSKFQGTLKLAESTVAGTASGMVADILKFQFAVTGAFTAVGFGVIGYIDKLAMGDQQMRLFAQRSFMTINQARGIKTALDTLGVSLEDVAWDKELHGRFETLIDDQKALSAMLGPQYEKQMLQVRDVRFELERLQVKGQYFGMKFAGDLLKKLGFGDGDLLDSLKKLNDYVLKNMPQWADELSTNLVPILHDFWDILKGLGLLAKDAALEFTNLVGVFSGDASIQGATFDFHKFAAAVEKVAHWAGVAVEKLIQVERIAVKFAPVIGGAAGGAGVGAMFGGIGAVPGAVIGGLGGAVVMGLEHRGSQGAGPSGGGSGVSIRDAAKAVGARLGIPADVIWADWAHETGNFTNRGARDLNNLAGIRIPGTKTYAQYDSIDSFANAYTHVLQNRRYAGIGGAQTPEDFAHILKHGGYYEGPEADYARNMGFYKRQYDKADAGITIGSIPINIHQPGASHHEIQAAVTKGVRDGLAEHSQQNMTQLAGGF